MRFNVFPGPVCRHWTSLFSASLDVLSAGLLRSLSLFRFFSLSAFLSTPALAPLSLSLISACRSPPTPSTSFLSLSLSVMFPQLFQPPPPEAIPFPPAAFLLTPFSPSHPTTFRVVYHFSSASGNPLFPIHQSSTGASFPWNVPRFPLRISITNFRQSNYSLRKEEKKCSFLFRELWKRLAEKGSRWTGGKKEVARHDEWTNRFPSRIFFSIRARERTKA